MGHIVNVNNTNAPKKAMSINIDLMLKPQLKLFLIERGMTETEVLNVTLQFYAYVHI